MASTPSGKRRSCKGKGGRGAGGASGGGGGAVGGGGGNGLAVGVVAGVEVSLAAVEAEEAQAVAVGAEVAEVAAVEEAVAEEVELVGVALRSGAARVVVRANSSSSALGTSPPLNSSVSGASRSFFRDRTTLTPLGRPVAVSLADPSGGPVLSHTSPLSSRVRRPPLAPCLVFTSPRSLRTCLPRSLPPLPPGPGPICVPCVEVRQRAAPHSSQFPPTEAPLQTLHMDMWDPARVRGQGHERYFMLVVDDYSRYTTVFPLRSKGDVNEVVAVLPPHLSSLLSSQDVTFDESVPYYRLFPYRTPSLPATALFLVPSPPPVNPLPLRVLPLQVCPGRTHSSLSRLLVTLVLLGVLSLGVLTLGVLSMWVLRLGVLGLRGATPGGAEPEGATSRGVEPGGATSGAAEHGVRSLRALGLFVWRLAVLDLEVLRVLPLGGSQSLHRSCASGLPGAGGVLLELELLRLLRVLVSRVPKATAAVLEAVLLGCATGAAGGPAAGGAVGAGTAAGGAGAVPAVSGVPAWSRSYFVPPFSRFLSSLLTLADLESDSLRAPSPTVTCHLATVVTDPSFESTATSALVAELVDFAVGVV
ncbi:unnamed protein product [Closterium sp. NIES-64]|nr:unnamed protein product [Closterium sp. NIES-64]